MWEDPIVADVHRTREQLAAEHSFDVKAIFADLRRRQVALGERLVPQKKRAESRTNLAQSGEDGSPVSTSAEAIPAN